ncbi:hypothetical protein BC629DRAFT_1599804 [Irpex lacteus]|nr:hypothetical protein BC629DRAFT_1599804 [Irpex lacteus]
MPFDRTLVNPHSSSLVTRYYAPALRLLAVYPSSPLLTPRRFRLPTFPVSPVSGHSSSFVLRRTFAIPQPSFFAIPHFSPLAHHSSSYSQRLTLARDPEHPRPSSRVLTGSSSSPMILDEQEYYQLKVRWYLHLMSARLHFGRDFHGVDYTGKHTYTPLYTFVQGLLMQQTVVEDEVA